MGRILDIDLIYMASKIQTNIMPDQTYLFKAIIFFNNLFYQVQMVQYLLH